jgi:hypothetical protein
MVRQKIFTAEHTHVNIMCSRKMPGSAGRDHTSVLSPKLVRWSLWLTNAVTGTSQDLVDYDRATELERSAWSLLEIPVSTGMSLN